MTIVKHSAEFRVLSLAWLNDQKGMMSSPRKKLFAWICLVIATGFVALWILGLFGVVDVWYGYANGSRRVRIFSAHGQICIASMVLTPSPGSSLSDMGKITGLSGGMDIRRQSMPQTIGAFFQMAFHGFEIRDGAAIWTDGDYEINVVHHYIFAPTWFFVLLFLLPPAWILLQRRRFPDGCCATCGYDLRGSLHSRQCPECGEFIPRAVTATESKMRPD